MTEYTNKTLYYIGYFPIVKKLYLCSTESEPITCKLIKGYYNYFLNSKNNSLYIINREYNERCYIGNIISFSINSNNGFIGIFNSKCKCINSRINNIIKVIEGKGILYSIRKGIFYKAFYIMYENERVGIYLEPNK